MMSAQTPFAAPADTFVDALRAQRDEAPARQAALVLHALPVNDRHWLLEQLAPAHRARLGELLGELEQLRIPAAAALLDDVRRSVADGAMAQPVFDDADARGRRLALADPKAIAALLEREPAALAARLLALREWPWKTAVLEQLSPARRRQVQARLAASPSSSASLLDRRLPAMLEERLAEAAAARQRRVSGWVGARGLGTPDWLKRLRDAAGAGLASISRAQR